MSSGSLISYSGPVPEMPADPDILEAQLEKLEAMVRQGLPEDRCRLRRTIEIIMRARKAVLEISQIVQQAREYQVGADIAARRCKIETDRLKVSVQIRCANSFR
jgi:tRNA A37 N6-isopentenylltransferase MiaA